MQLNSKPLLDQLDRELLSLRKDIVARPGIALIWVGDDKQTGKFVEVKKQKAKDLDCEFILHHFEQASHRQLETMIEGFNNHKDIDGIVLQLPLPKDINDDRLIELIDPNKDIDGLTIDGPYDCPTPTGIIELLKFNDVDLSKTKTVIIGAGRLVGLPLSKVFKENNWPYKMISQNAENRVQEIREADLVIACTGVEHLVTPEMVRPETILVDGSGVDVDTKLLEPLVKLITPTKGAIGPLTVGYLFQNLLISAS